MLCNFEHEIINDDYYCNFYLRYQNLMNLAQNIKAVANAPVLVTANINIKVLVDLKLQLRRFKSILNISRVSNNSFFMWRIEKEIIVSEFLLNLTNIYFLPVFQLF